MIDEANEYDEVDALLVESIVSFWCFWDIDVDILQWKKTLPENVLSWVII